VLITGRNGSGKTTLMHAITLLLNGYDERIFKANSSHIDLITLFCSEKVASLEIHGMPDQFKMLEKNQKEWQDWASPFEMNRSLLGSSLARVSSAYFQDCAEELANGEFLSYLTGSGNQGQQVQNWTKDRVTQWKERADDSLPSEKNWDDERKKILDQIVSLPQNQLAGSRFEDQFSEFKPFLRNRNLAEHWQSQITNLGERFGVEKNEYSIDFLDFFRLQIKSKLEEWEIGQKKEFKSRLRDMLDEYQEDIEILPPERWNELEKEKKELEHAIDELRNNEKQFKDCEPQTSAIENILGILNDEIDDAKQESKRLSGVKVPLPQDLTELFAHLEQNTYAEYGKSYNKWRDSISKELSQFFHEITKAKTDLEKLDLRLQILGLMEKIPAVKKLLETETNVPIISLLKELETSGPSQSSIINQSSVEDGLHTLEKTIFSLTQLESDFKQHSLQKQKMTAFHEAKQYAGSWSSAFVKESKRNATLSEILNFVDTVDVEDTMKNILSMFHLHPKYISEIRFKRKGTGNKAIVVPALGDVDFGNLSTGEKTLFALAWTTVLNLSFHKQLGHNVMLFDDITTSLDLNQITPACVLFRKLAYTHEDQKRRQLFISSHHEDLTNRLIDNLIPPEGRSMKVLEIQDFTVDKGPIIDPWDVAPAKTSRAGGGNS
jgi:DNA repair exonuclease SbcCD ATPase subunit